MLFQPFKSATRARAPQLTQATIQQGQMEAAADKANRAQRFNEIVGGAQLYNTAMGDRTPIADYLFGPEKAAETAATGAETAEALRTAATAGTGAGAAVPTATAAAPVAASAAPTAATTAATGGAGSAVLSTMPWLAMAYLLANQPG